MLRLSGSSRALRHPSAEGFITVRQMQHISLCPQSPSGHVAQELRAWIKAAGYSASVEGGGFVDYDPGAATVYVYGISNGFGKADHLISAMVLSSWNSSLKVSTDDSSGFFG